MQFLKKLEPLIVKNEGNLSAAMRDAIELADVALKTYGSKEKAASAIVTKNGSGIRDHCATSPRWRKKFSNYWKN